MKLNSLLEGLKKSSHTPVAIFVFLVTTVFHFKTGKDLGPNYTNSIYALYAFLGGHAVAQLKWGNADGDTTTPPATSTGT